MTPAAERSRHTQSPLAQSMVLASMREPGSGVYILQDVCASPVHLDAVRLRIAWNHLANRHPALRTSISLDRDGLASGRVHAEPPDCWREMDWNGLQCAEIDERLTAFLKDDRRAGFDLESGVPVRVTLVRTDGGDSVILCAHHAILDGRSLLTLWREWFEIYDSLSEDCAIDPAEVAVPGPSAAEEPARAFWRDNLAGLDKTTGFVTDRLKSATSPAAARYEECRFTASRDLTEKLRDFAREQGVTLATLLEAAWAILLSRYSAQNDIVFGVTHSGRGPDEQTAVGLFINTLPTRIRVEPGASVGEWLREIRRDLLAIREHLQPSVEEVMTWAGLPAGSAPFDSVVVYDHEPPEESLRKLGGDWERRTLRRFQTSATPLMLAAYGAPALVMTIAYDTSQYCAATAGALLDHLETILLSLCAPESTSIGDVEMLTASERAIYLERRTADRKPGLCLHSLFEQQTRATPEEIALETAGQSISYRALNQRANRIARTLRRRGIRPGDFAAISLPHVSDTIAALLGVLKSGAAFLLLDPGAPGERRADMLGQIQPAIVLDDIAEIEGGEDGSGEDHADLTPAAHPDDAAYAIFTSGSTGRPKAIVVPHRAIANQIFAVTPIYQFRPTDRRLQFASLASDVFVSETFSCLASGATIVITPDARKSSLQEFNRLLEEKRITLVSMPGSWWNTWAAAMSAGTIRLASTVRTLLVGMEKVDPAVFRDWRLAAGTHVRWFNVYGPAENSPVSTVYQAGASIWECDAMLPIGKPLVNTSAYVLDENRKLAAPGVIGELYVSGDGLAVGYLGDPKRTAERFIDDPFRPGERMYRTGDRAFALPDGNIVFAGRTDRQIKVRGYRVELDEVEAALSHHPSVSECAVAPAGSEGNVRLVAYVASSAPESELRAHLARLLPEYMLPAAWVKLPVLPHTESGKIDRVALAASEHTAVTPSIETARWTHAEERLAALWREVLDVPVVDITDDFFRMGGSSLSATRLLVRIEQEFGIELSLASVFETPTLARLAARLDGHENQHRHGLIALESRGAMPPFVCIGTSMLGVECFRQLARSLGGEQPFYIAPELTTDFSENAVPGLAEQAATTIRAAMPEGPYTLGGYCFGGVVAYKTAQILARGGAEIRTVVLFDSATPGYPKLLASGGNYFRQLGRFFRRRPSKSAAPSNIQEIQEHAAMVSTLLKRKAAARYTPEPAQFPVVQFIAAAENISTRVLEDPRLGWRDLCRGEFELHYIEGTHGSLFSAECAPRIAAILQARFRGNPTAHHSARGSGAGRSKRS